MAEEEVPETVGEAMGKPGDTTELAALLGVDVEITAVLGTAMMPISQILKLGRGAVVELNHGVDDYIEIHANNRVIAMGEVVVIEDRLGVTMTDIIKLTGSATD